MAIRSIATLSLSFGLVSIPVKVYSATESSAAIRFKLLSRAGQRVRREYVADDAVPVVAAETEPAAPPAARATAPRASVSRSASNAPPETEADDDGHDVELEPEAPARHRASLGQDELVKAYEFEKGRFVTFTADELKALAEASRPTIDIVSFIPEGSVDATFYDKAYYLAPDKPGSKPYSLLHAAMRSSGRAALAKWAWRGKEYVVQIRPSHDGMVLQQLLYADEVRAIDDLGIALAPVAEAELDLALRLIAQIAEEAYDPGRFVDEEKQRILAAVERKIAGRKVVAQPATAVPSAQVIDLMAALRASLGAAGGARAGASRAGPRPAAPRAERDRKPVRRAAKTAATAAVLAPAPATRARRRQSGR